VYTLTYVRLMLILVYLIPFKGLYQQLCSVHLNIRTTYVLN